MSDPRKIESEREPLWIKSIFPFFYMLFTGSIGSYSIFLACERRDIVGFVLGTVCLLLAVTYAVKLAILEARHA